MLKCVSTEWEMEAYMNKPTERHCVLSSHIKPKAINSWFCKTCRQGSINRKMSWDTPKVKILLESVSTHEVSEGNVLKTRHWPFGETQEDRNKPRSRKHSPQGERLYQQRTFSPEERRLITSMLSFQVHKECCKVKRNRVFSVSQWIGIKKIYK